MYTKGIFLPQDQNAVAIVGSRKPTKQGLEIAYKFAYEIAKADITIISGLARGIDSAAHKAALDAAGRTIAVLGSGLDIIYPPENKKLAEEIMKSGVLVSEFPQGTKPFAKNFLARNRVIAKLSKAVLVIEGKRRSGTLSTAGWAADEGKEVFAVPGSEITDYLIENGSSIAYTPQDIIGYIKS